MITILGPTASGKTDIATHLAAELSAEIISADSRQVYRRMDIGTGKDLADYVVDGKRVPYHLIDIVEPGTKYNLFEYQRDFLEAYNDIRSRGKNVILCGGTGLYIESVLKGYRLIPVPENKELRHKLEGKSLLELTSILERLKAENNSNMHNSTDVDTSKRAIRAIEIEMAYKEAHIEERTFPKIDNVIIGVGIDRDLRRWLAPLNETAKGVSITTKADGTFDYKVIDVEKRDYKEYMYYCPIPYSEILKWSNLQQNYGW